LCKAVVGKISGKVDDLAAAQHLFVTAVASSTEIKFSEHDSEVLIKWKWEKQLIS